MIESRRVRRDHLDEALFIHACPDAVPGYAKRDFGYGKNCFANRGRRANGELSSLAGEKRFPAPDIRPNFRVLGIVEGHAPVFRRLRRKPGTDLIRCDDALRHVEADRHMEISIGEYDSACIAAQPVDLVTGVRSVVAYVLVPSL